MLYINDRIEQLDLKAALSAVSEQRRTYALRYRHEHDQRLCVAAYQLLQQALNIEYGISEMPLFDYDSHGKPSLAGHHEIYFNLSHCHEAAACVVSNAPVGIDIESIGRYDEELVETVMNTDEQRIIRQSSNPPLSFIRLWTMKESLVKLTGEGLSKNMQDVLKVNGYHFQTTIFPHFVCTVCEYKRE